MKKFTIAALFVSALTITACHYGQNEAKDTLERNELYKGDKAEYSVNRAGEGGKLNSEAKPAATVDTAAVKAVEPAAVEHHESK